MNLMMVPVALFYAAVAVAFVIDFVMHHINKGMGACGHMLDLPELDHNKTAGLGLAGKKRVDPGHAPGKKTGVIKRGKDSRMQA